MTQFNYFQCKKIPIILYQIWVRLIIKINWMHKYLLLTLKPIKNLKVIIILLMIIQWIEGHQHNEEQLKDYGNQISYQPTYWMKANTMRKLKCCKQWCRVESIKTKIRGIVDRLVTSMTKHYQVGISILSQIIFHRVSQRI